MIHDNKIIKGQGDYIPDRTLPNMDIEGMVGASAQWVKDNLGISNRHIADESVSDMGYKASMRAIVSADITPHDVGCIIVSCSSSSHHAPSIASQIMRMLNITVPCFDINAVCSGFVYGLEIACSLNYENTLLIGVEKYSSLIDWSNRDCVYFGDGAGSVIVSRGNGRITTKIYADGKSGDAFVCESGRKYSMVGRKVYNRAIEVLPTAIREAMAEVGVTDLNKFDYVIPHQAGIRVLRDLMDKFSYPMERCITIMDDYANMASASIPIAMGRVKPNNILLVTIGSGWTWGVAIIQQTPANVVDLTKALRDMPEYAILRGSPYLPSYFPPSDIDILCSDINACALYLQSVVPARYTKISDTQIHLDIIRGDSLDVKLDLYGEYISPMFKKMALATKKSMCGIYVVSPTADHISKCYEALHGKIKYNNYLKYQYLLHEYTI